MKKIIQKPLNSWIIKPLSLAILFSTVNCGCGSNKNNPRTTKTIYDSTNEKKLKKIEITLTAANDKIIDNDIIEFQLVNKGTEAIDLNDIIVNLELREQKDDRGQQITKGSISPIFPNSNMVIISAKGINGKPAADFMTEKTLKPSNLASIFIRIVELEGLASGLVTCQLLNGTDKNREIAIKKVSFNFSNPTGPKADSSIEIELKDVTFNDKSQVLAFGINIKNTSSHPISLASLKFNFEFDRPIKGTAKFDAQELFGEDNSILKSGQEKDIIPIAIRITNNEAIEALKNTIRTDGILEITPQISTKEGNILYNKKQLVRLS